MALRRYVEQLWRGEIPFSRVFWTDMLTVGTLVNIAAMLAAMFLLLADAPGWVGFGVHFAPVPYNALLFMAVDRSAAAEFPGWAWLAQAAAALWFLAMLVI